MENARKKVLVLNPYYLPGFRFGGPEQSVINLCDAYRDRADIYLLTQNHEYQEDTPYEGIPANEWLSRDGIHIQYMDQKSYGFQGIKKVYSRFDTALTCGLFEINTVTLLLIHRFFHKKGQTLYVAPMGVFSQGALNHKGFKKRAFLKLMGLLGCFKNIRWCFSSPLEREEARGALGERALHRNDVIAEDLPRSADFDQALRRIQTEERPEGEIKIAFLSRIVPKKNLSQCAEILSLVPGDKSGITFHIYGVAEDQAYWQSCQNAFQSAGVSGITKEMGAVRPENVIATLQNYDCFLFPTLGENYGHVIYEALAAGCAVILSDQTPWQDLSQQGCGFVLPLKNSQAFADAISSLLGGGRKEINRYRENAVLYAREKYRAALAESGYDRIFIDQD